MGVTIRQKGYILKKDGNKKRITKTVSKKIKDYVKYHYISTLGYLTSTFLFADGSYKAFVGDIDSAKDELLLGFAIGGLSKGYKSGFEMPGRTNKKEEVLGENYSQEAIAYATNLLKDVMPKDKLDFIGGPQISESRPLEFLYEQFEINKILKEEFSIDPKVMMEDLNDITDIGERIIRENMKLIEMLPD